MGDRSSLGRQPSLFGLLCAFMVPQGGTSGSYDDHYAPRVYHGTNSLIGHVSDSFTNGGSELDSSYTHYEGDSPNGGYLYYYTPYGGRPCPEEKDALQHAPEMFFTFLVVPLLALFGVSLALPAAGYVLQIGRDIQSKEKRFFLGSAGDALRRIEQAYKAATGSEECLRRLVCDLGASENGLDRSFKGVIIRGLEKWTPEVYSSFARDYAAGLDGDPCDRFICQTSL